MPKVVNFVRNFVHREERKRSELSLTRFSGDLCSATGVSLIVSDVADAFFALCHISLAHF